MEIVLTVASALLLGFVVFHMLGNLKLYLGAVEHNGAFDYDANIYGEWLRDLLAPASEGESDSDFLSRVRADLFDDRVYALTPKGEVVDLPSGATPIDFAYHVHTELGHRCRGARIDGVMVPLNTGLLNEGTLVFTGTGTIAGALTTATGMPSLLTRNSAFVPLPRFVSPIPSPLFSRLGKSRRCTSPASAVGRVRRGCRAAGASSTRRRR